MWESGEAKRGEGAEASNGCARACFQRRNERPQQALSAPIESACRAHSGARRHPRKIRRWATSAPSQSIHGSAATPVSISGRVHSTPPAAHAVHCAAAKCAGDVHVCLGAGRRSCLCLTAANDDSGFLHCLPAAVPVPVPVLLPHYLQPLICLLCSAAKAQRWGPQPCGDPVAALTT